MKKLLFLPVLMLFAACVTKKDTIGTLSNCPSEGVCKYTRHKNTALEIKKDDVGSLYYQKVTQSGKTTFTYVYEQNKDQAYVDGHYIEEIVFEVDDSFFDKDVENQPLKKVLFNVSCFCKGKAGGYEVPEATISYNKKAKNLTVTIDTVIEGQVLKVIQIPEE